MRSPQPPVRKPVSEASSLHAQDPGSLRKHLPGLWKNCLPCNCSLMPEKLGPAVINGMHGSPVAPFPADYIAFRAQKNKTACFLAISYSPTAALQRGGEPWVRQRQCY